MKEIYTEAREMRVKVTHVGVVDAQHDRVVFENDFGEYEPVVLQKGHGLNEGDLALARVSLTVSLPEAADAKVLTEKP